MAINWNKTWAMMPDEAAKKRKAEPKGAIDWETSRNALKKIETEKRQKVVREEVEKRNAEREAARQAALEANKAKTLELLQEGQRPVVTQYHPTGGALTLSQEEMERLGLTNEAGFAYGGKTLGMSEEEIQKLVQPGAPRLYEAALVQATQSSMTQPGRKDYLGYLAGEFGAGVISSPAGILAGAQTALGDLMTGGDVSRGMMALTQYFDQNPQMKDRWMRNEFGVGEMIRQETGATDAQMEAYRTANMAGWIRSSLQQDRGAGIGQGFKDTAGNIAFTLGQQAPGLAYSALTPAASGGSGIIGAAMDAAKTGGSVAKAAGGATLDALKGNIATWMIGASSAGNQLTALAQERGYDPKNYMNALGTGFSEYFTEGLFGITDAQSIGKIWTNTGSRGANVLRALGNWIGSGAEEGLEEAVNVPMGGVVEKMTTNPDKKLVGEGGIFDLKAMIDAGIDGAIVGLLMGSVGAVSAIRTGVQEGGDLRAAAEATNRVIDTLPEQFRPEPIEPQSTTEETLEAKQAEVLQALQEIGKTEQDSFAQDEKRPVQTNAQEQTGDVQTDAQEVDVISEENEGFTQPEESNAQDAQQEQSENVQNRTLTAALEENPTYRIALEQFRSGQLSEREFQNQLTQFVAADPELAQIYQQTDDPWGEIEGGDANNVASEVLSGGGQEWRSAPVDTGSAGTVERTGATAAERSQTSIAQERTRAARERGLTPTTAQALGLESGSDVARTIELPEDMWDDELLKCYEKFQEQNRARREKYGAKQDLKLRFVLGAVEVMDADGNSTLVDGVVTDEGDVVVRVNSLRHSATELTEHELFHVMTAEYSGLDEYVWNTVVSGDYGINDGLVQQYRRFYGEKLGYTEQMVREEILADAYSGFERVSGTNMRSVQDVVREYVQRGTEEIEKGWTPGEASETYQDVEREGRETRAGPRYALADIKVPKTYEELIAKPDVNIVDIRTGETGRVSDRRSAFINSDDVEGMYKTPVTNKDTGERIFVTKKTIKHSFSNQGAEQINAVKKLRNIIAESVLTHKEQSYVEDDGTTGIYQFFGAVRTGNGVTPTKVTVKEYVLDGRSVPPAVAGYIAENPKVTEYASAYDNRVLIAENEEAASSAPSSADINPTPYKHPAASTISVDELMQLVKGDARKYIPKRISQGTEVKQRFSISDEVEAPENFRDVPTEQATADNRAAVEQTELLRKLTGKEAFRGSKSLDELGVRIAGSTVDYHLVEQMLQNHRAAKSVQRDIKKAEQKLGATADEKSYAAGIASGLYSEDNIPPKMDARRVLELADYYILERSVGMDLLKSRRDEMYSDVDYEVETLMRDNEAVHISANKIMFYRTPLRNMIRMYGREQGQRIYDYLFAPVSENEAERYRWTNRMYDVVRQIEGSDGKKKPLNKKERALVQMVMEGRAAAEMTAAMDERQTVYDAAHNLRNGQSMDDVSREFNLNQQLRDAASDYATWLDTKEQLDTADGVDKVRIENAVQLYAEQYNKFYDAINDFLVAHGYEPIGFIKGYAPHIQPEDNKNLLEAAMKTLGVSNDVSDLPTAIAGRTHVYRPNKRWNPYFLSRHGGKTEYDVAAGYESYVDYLSDILFHMDDTVRIRRAANYFRRTYAPEEISESLSWAEGLRTASPEQKAELLRDAGKLSHTETPKPETINALFENHISELYESIKDQSKYSNFVNWLEDYANQLTGKQSLADRGMEVWAGRQSLNLANKLTRAFQQANTAGNISTAFNQTGQLPLIVADNGLGNTLLALKDYATGRTRRDGFRERSDFLTGKRGIDKLVIDPAERVMNILFTPAQIADDMMSQIAVRGAYIKALRQGMSEAEALQYADRKGEQLMGSRMKGSAPQMFRSKNTLVRMINMFQVEALNTFEYVEQDTILQGVRDIKQIDDSKGKSAAVAAMVSLLGKMVAAAFLWNRATEELYGGSPAQFDIMGYAANFLASGNGLTVNEQLMDWIDLAWERAFGEPLFDVDPDYNEDFDWESAVDDLTYDVSSDLPLVRNIAGLLGVGDQSLPAPDASKVFDAIDTAMKAGASAESVDAFLAAAAEFLPGGRQLNKTYQGARTMYRGGRYYGYGDNERLQYPVEQDWMNWAKALLFGPAGLSENAEFYASGGEGLSAAQTANYQELMMSGMSSEMALEAYEEYRRLNRLETMTASEKATELALWTVEMELPEDQAALVRETFKFYSVVPGEATRYDEFVGNGLDPQEAHELTQALSELEPEDGETNVSSLQRYEEIIDHIGSEEMRIAALAGVMPEKEFAKLDSVQEYVESEEYIAFLRAFKDAYPEDSKSQDRVESVLQQMDLDNEARAALWQMCGVNWKYENNPYSSTIGKQVQAAIKEKYAEIDGKEE